MGDWGCTQSGTGGRHSDRYYTGNTCEWCGAHRTDGLDFPDVKLCKECRWCVVSPHEKPFLGVGSPSYEFARCTHPKAVQDQGGRALVDGSGAYCTVQRDYTHTACGREGRLWERK